MARIEKASRPKSVKSGSTSDDWLIVTLLGDELEIEPDIGTLRAIDVPGMDGNDVLVVVEGLEEASRLELLSAALGMGDVEWSNVVSVDDHDFMDCLDIREFEAHLRASKIRVPGPVESELRSIEPDVFMRFHLRWSNQALLLIKGAAINLGLKDDYGNHDYVVADNPRFLPDMLTEAICAAEEIGL